MDQENLASIGKKPLRRRSPLRRVWIVLAVLALVIAIVRGTDLLGDHAYANVATVVLGFIAAVTLVVWFCFFSGYSLRVRIMTMVGCAAVIAAFPALFRLDRVNGELVPTFVFRYAPKHDQKIRERIGATTGRGGVCRRPPYHHCRRLSPIPRPVRGVFTWIDSAWRTIGPRGLSAPYGGTILARVGPRFQSSTDMRSPWNSAATPRWSRATT